MTVWSDFAHNLPALPKKSEEQSTNPITLCRSLSWLQWGFFMSGWLAWCCDAIDFFAVSLTVARLVEQFDKETHSITTSITLTLLFRPAGAIIFGLLSDRYGRKWPLIANLVVCAVLSLGTGCVNTFPQFLAVRSLFGVAMGKLLSPGGIWGQAASLSLENMPVEARGLFSGILQQGYAVGYLIAAVVNLTAVAQRDSWRVLFYVGAGISLFAALVRLALPESQYFVERQEAERNSATAVSSSQKSKTFMREAGRALKTHWIRCVFAILLMSGFNFYSHGSQDLFPTYIQKGKGLSAHAATVATIIGNCGAIVGGTAAGYISQYLGRRLTIIVCCIWTCCWLPLWLLPTTFGPLAAGAFFLQAGVQGAWGVIPIYLSEISPVAFRAVWPGVAYQLGNMVSSASSQIEATAGDRLKTPAGLPDYGKVSAILIGVVSGWIIVLSLVGKEAHSTHFEKGKAAFEEGGGLDMIEDGSPTSQQSNGSTTRRSVDEEKGVIGEKEYAQHQHEKEGERA